MCLLQGGAALPRGLFRRGRAFGKRRFFSRAVLFLVLEQEGLTLLARALLRRGDSQELVDGMVGEARLEVFRFYAGELARKTVNFAVKIDDDVGTLVAAGEIIAAGVEGFDERAGVGAFAPGLRDLLHALFFGRAAAFLLLFLGEVLRFRVVGETVLAAVVAHAGRKGEIVIFGVLLRDGAKFLPVVRELHGFHFFRIDAGPYDVTVLAPVFDVEDDGAGLAGEAESFFRAADEIVVVLAGEGTLRVVGVDGQGVELFTAVRGFCFRVPFGKRAVQVLRNGAPHVGDFNPVVIVGVKQMGSELLTARALVAFGDHIPIIESCG